MDQVPATTPTTAFAAVGLLRKIDWPKAYFWVRYGRFSGLRVRVAKRRVPATRETGFLGAAVEVSVSNVGRGPVVVRDVRLMFLGAYGAPVESSVPAGVTDPALPASLAPGEERHWYVRGRSCRSCLPSSSTP